MSFDPRDKSARSFDEMRYDKRNQDKTGISDIILLLNKISTQLAEINSAMREREESDG